PDLDSLLSKSEGDFNRMFVYELCLNIVELECLSRDSSMTYDIKLYFTFQLRSFLALEVFIATKTVSRAIRANTIGITTAPARAWNMNSDELLAPLVIQSILLIFCGEGGVQGPKSLLNVFRSRAGNVVPRCNGLRQHCAGQFHRLRHRIYFLWPDDTEACGGEGFNHSSRRGSICSALER